MGHRHSGGLTLGRTGVLGTLEPARLERAATMALQLPSLTIYWVERFSTGGPLSGSFENNHYKLIHKPLFNYV